VNYTAIAEYSQIASAVLFVIVMIWIWLKFIQPAVVTAQQNANAQLSEGERHRDEAKRQLDALQGETDNARRDAEAIRQRVQAQAQSEREAILRESREAGERAVRNAEGELERSRLAAREKLRDDLLEQALQLARTQASQKVDASVNGKLVASFLNSIENRGGLN
jgi:F0F1-type ATP synthase membrane subunit b/b'